MGVEAKIEVPSAPAVLSAINAVMEHCAKEGISKARKNQQQGYTFRGIDDVYNALCGVLAANKLTMLPFVQEMRREERQNKSGGALNYTILTVDFKIACAVDGSHEMVRVVGEAMDSADKSANKAQSAALKYAAMQVFMIPTESDNDADATTHEVASSRREGQSEGRAVSPPADMPDSEWAKLVQLLDATKADTKAMLDYYKVENLRQLDQQQYGHAIKNLTDKLAKLAKDETNAKAGNLADALDDAINF